MDRNGREQVEKEQNRSSIDRANDFISRIQDARRTVNILKNIRSSKGAAEKIEGSTARGGAKVAGRAAAQVGRQGALTAGEFLVASSEAWVPLLLIILIIILIIVSLSVIFGGIQEEKESLGGSCDGISTSSDTATPTSPITLNAVNCNNVPAPLVYRWSTTDLYGNLSDPAGETTTYTPSSSTVKDVTITLVICSQTDTGNCSTDTIVINYSTLIACSLDYTRYPAQCLREVFNVAVRYDSNISHLATIYKIFASTNSQRYKQLLRNGGNILYVDVPYCTGVCISATSANKILLNGFFSRGLSYQSQRYLLIHESGHVISGRNRQLSDSFSNNLLARQDGTSCYQYHSTYCSGSYTSGYFLRSYALRYYCPTPSRNCWVGAITAHNESFAEAIANHLFTSRNTSYLCSVPISSVGSACPNTQVWIRNNIYGW